MWFKIWYHLHAKEKINGVHKHGGHDSKHDITYKLRKKISKDGGCDLKHNITYWLREK